jgi:guanidinobutyrase
VLLRPYNMATKAAPFDSKRVADLGDVAINPYNLLDSIARIEQAFDRIVGAGCTPISLGGDHTVTLPILRAIHRRHGPVGLIHIDAHADVNDEMFGEKIAHGTPFRRAAEEGLIDPNRVVQIGLRGTGYTAEDFDWCRRQGFQVVQVEECWGRSLAPLMRDIRARLGSGPVYFTLDIDGIDPAYAPGTGTPEIAGLTVPQVLEIIRGSWGLDFVGARGLHDEDLVRRFRRRLRRRPMAGRRRRIADGRQPLVLLNGMSHFLSRRTHPRVKLH